MSRAQYLYRLQAIDSQIDETNQYLARIKANLGKTKALLNAEAKAKTTAQSLREVKTRLTNFEFELKGLSDKIKTQEKRLYGGKNMTAKEAGNLQEEVASLKRRYATIEEQLLEIMIATEETETIDNETQATLVEIQATWKDEQAKLTLLQRQFEQKLVSLKEQRSIAASKINASDMAEYNQLRAKKNRRAVTGVKEGACLACNVSISNSKLQRTRAGNDLNYCGTCGRILYVL
ncbi:hypothetical protein QUF58_01875 [Anaerolineales bacterium HSG24]|nr:hypothetical protein [Anaerolineales bacterium HSG24]